jgi:GNAT superfamily N-acetyltransferase
MNLHIRLANQDDLDQLAELRWQARLEGGEENPNLSLDEFKPECIRLMRAWMQSGSYMFWVASTGDMIVAHIAVHRVDLLPRPIKIRDQFGVITENYTRPAYRSRGIGSQLIRRVIEGAREVDHELLIVYPSHEARPFYARAGFSGDSEVMEYKLREYVSESWINDPHKKA